LAAAFRVTGTAAAGETVPVPFSAQGPSSRRSDVHGRHALGVSGRPGSGTAIAISFFVVAVVCGFGRLCYAELASMIPSQAARTPYTYATLGELIAWIIGWDLILEYAVSNMALRWAFPHTSIACLIPSGFIFPRC